MREVDSLTDTRPFIATCDSPPPINMRGSKYPPGFDSVGSNGRSYRVSTYDASNGLADIGSGQSLMLGGAKGGSMFGDNSWQALLVGPVSPG